MGGVFINYRGSDSRAYGALLHVTLSAAFGEPAVFLDSRSIPPGADFVDTLLGRVRDASVLLAVIGPTWLTAADDTGRRRLDLAGDWIRRELVTAFESGTPVVPVLVDGAAMPREPELPAELARLSRCQYLELRHRNSRYDLQQIVDRLAGQHPDLRAARAGQRRRAARWKIALSALAIAAGVGVAAVLTHQLTTGRADTETGDAVSQVGDTKSAGGLYFALPDQVTAPPSEAALGPTGADPAEPELAGRRAVPVGTLTVSFQIRGNRRTPVQITDIRSEITSRTPVVAGTLFSYPPPGGEQAAITLVDDLDLAQPDVRDPADLGVRWFDQHHVQLAQDENQQFEVTFTARSATYSFRIVVEYVTADGGQHRLVVGRPDGRPFTVTGWPPDNRYDAVYQPNYPEGPGWRPCFTWTQDRCKR